MAQDSQFISAHSHEGQTHPGFAAGPPSEIINRRRRSQKHIACDGCRRSKISCDGLRPCCTACLQKKKECQYRMARAVKDATNLELESQLQRLQQQNRHHEELMSRLLTSSETESAALLRRLRSAGRGTNPLDYLSSSVGGSMHGTMRPSDVMTTRAIAAPTSSLGEFWLMAQYPTAYPMLQPIRLAEIEGLWRTETASQSEDMASSAGDVAKSEHDFSSPSSPLGNSSSDGNSNVIWMDPPSVVGMPARPVPPPRFCDERLQELHISYWTRAPLSDHMAATLISFYLETEHSILGFFDADLFLDDLVHCRQEFCSAFQVNAVLCVACQAYTAIRPQITAIRPSLFRETEMLWRGEASTDSLVSVAALGLFSVACIYEGRDELGRELALSGRRMSERLGLFGGQEDKLVTEPDVDEASARWVRAASYIAWGAYNWQTIHVLFYCQEPVRYPPRLPVPGEGRDAVAPSHMGTMLPKTCRLWTVVHEIAAVYMFGQEKPVLGRVPVAFVEAKYQKLVRWIEGLDKSNASRTEQSSFDLVLFHMMFHVVVAVLFRPFTLAPDDYRLGSFHNVHPKTIYTASVHQLKDLVFRYRSRYAESSCTAFFNPGLITLVLAVLEEQQEQEQQQQHQQKQQQGEEEGPSWRHYFLLCVRCWRDLYVCYPVFSDIAQAFLSLAVQRGAMSLAETQRIMEDIRRHGQHHGLSADGRSTSFVFDPFTDTPDGRRIHDVALKLEEMVLFSDLTTGIL